MFRSSPFTENKTSFFAPTKGALSQGDVEWRDIESIQEIGVTPLTAVGASFPTLAYLWPELGVHMNTNFRWLVASVTMLGLVSAGCLRRRPTQTASTPAAEEGAASRAAEPTPPPPPAAPLVCVNYEEAPTVSSRTFHCMNPRTHQCTEQETSRFTRRQMLEESCASRVSGEGPPAEFGPGACPTTGAISRCYQSYGTRLYTYQGGQFFSGTMGDYYDCMAMNREGGAWELLCGDAATAAPLLRTTVGDQHYYSPYDHVQLQACVAPAPSTHTGSNTYHCMRAERNECWEATASRYVNRRADLEHRCERDTTVDGEFGRGGCPVENAAYRCGSDSSRFVTYQGTSVTQNVAQHECIGTFEAFCAQPTATTATPAATTTR